MWAGLMCGASQLLHAVVSIRCIAPAGLRCGVVRRGMSCSFNGTWCITQGMMGSLCSLRDASVPYSTVQYDSTVQHYSAALVWVFWVW
jgi:hypothetical protein